METISSALRAAGSALYSGGTAVSSAVTSAGSWLGRQVSWVPSSIKSSLAMLGSRKANPACGEVKNFTASNANSTSTDFPITAEVTIETALPEVSFKEFACYKTAARALAAHFPRNGTLKNAATLFTLAESPAVKQDKDLYNLYTKRAVTLVKEAISKFPPDVKEKIETTLSHLETQYDSLLKEAMGSSEFCSEEIKAALSKTAEEAFPSKLQQCRILKHKLDQLNADTKLLSYKSHFEIAQKHLKQAEDFYCAGKFNLGDQQYAYAHRFADTPRYMELREKLNITRVRPKFGSDKLGSEEIGSEDQYRIGNEALRRQEMNTRVKENPRNTALQNYWKAVSELEAAGKADSVEKYEASLKAVEEYLKPTKAMQRY